MRPARLNRDLYHVFGLWALLAIAAAALFFVLAVLPGEARAFWPFTSNSASAQVAPPAVRAPLLAAATNYDPNPDKGLADQVHTSGAALVASSGPEGTITDAVPSASSGRISVYVVREGDSLGDIAKMFGVSINTIRWANNLGSRAIRPGETLIILPVSGVEHKVVKGDTLRAIARKYAADESEIADFNGIDASKPLAVGSTIIVPGGEIAAPLPAKRPASGSTRILGGGGPLIEGFFGNPLPGGRVTQGLHGWNGIDIGAPRGTPVLASAAGTVIIARTGWNGGYGTYVVITHSNGTQTLYSHLSGTAVAPGATVGQGDIIGYVGNTGKSTGTHLHFEVRGAKNPLAR